MTRLYKKALGNPQQVTKNPNTKHQIWHNVVHAGLEYDKTYTEQEVKHIVYKGAQLVGISKNNCGKYKTPKEIKSRFVDTGYLTIVE